MHIEKVLYDSEFAVIAGNARSQAAVMVLAAGETTGGPDNRHKGSDQWLYVAEGEGTATIAGKDHKLKAGSLLLIEKGETHEIRNDSNKALKTLNFYVPPGYDASGEALSAGKPD